MDATQAPARLLEPSAERFALSIPRPRAIPPRDGMERLARVLDKPTWTRADRDRMQRAADGLREHQCRWLSETCSRCNLADRIDREIKEWDRIDKASPIPSTAQLLNFYRRPDRFTRQAETYKRLSGRLDARRREVLATVKPYKTDKARRKHELAALQADPTMTRIMKAMDRIRLMPRM